MYRNVYSTLNISFIFIPKEYIFYFFFLYDPAIVNWYARIERNNSKKKDVF